MNQYKILTLLETRSGVSQQTGREWKTRDVVLEENVNVAYPDRFVATLNGDAVDKMTAREGDVIGAELAFNAREHEGRWYQGVRIRNFEQNNR